MEGSVGEKEVREADGASSYRALHDNSKNFVFDCKMGCHWNVSTFIENPPKIPSAFLVLIK